MLLEILLYRFSDINHFGISDLICLNKQVNIIVFFNITAILFEVMVMSMVNFNFKLIQTKSISTNICDTNYNFMKKIIKNITFAFYWVSDTFS